MSKRYNEPIELQLAADQRPQAFIWRGRRYQIKQIVKHWTSNEAWWQKSAPRLHAVVNAQYRGEWGLYELFYEMQHGRWFLRSIYD